MAKKIALVIIIILAVAGSAAFYYRFHILHYSLEKLIRDALPGYVTIDKISFDFSGGRASFSGFRIANPEGFTYKYLIEISEVTCGYKLIGKTIFDGIEILTPVIRKPVLNIERLGDGRLNFVEMDKVTSGEDKGSSMAGPAKSKDGKPAPSGMVGGKKPSELIKIPESFDIVDGKILLLDRFTERPTNINFENIKASVGIKLDDMYEKLLWLASSGQGDLSGDKDQTIRWEISLNPLTKKLTMSNRFEVSGVDIVTFESYYDQYLPVVFRNGRFSGNMVFDFDNGNIGSTNEIRLSDFTFYIKRGYENAQFWQTSVPDLAKYLTSRSGEIIFDFKIKGEPPGLKFYLGPYAKQALTSMAVDKVGQILESLSGPQDGSAASGGKSDLDKAKEYIDFFSGLVKK